MTREELIISTLDKLLKLSDENLRKVSNFAELLLHITKEKDLAAGIRQIAIDSSFKFLDDEEDLYSINVLKEFQ